MADARPVYEACRRLGLAVRLAWGALRGRAITITVGDLDGHTTFTGVAWR